MEQILIELIALVKGASPHLWEIAIKQVDALNAADEMISLWLLGIIVLGGVIVFVAARHLNIYDSPGAYWAIYALVAICLVSIVLVNKYSIMLRVANPEYYAIQYLVELVK
jgi:uncharacterized membrane protein